MFLVTVLPFLHVALETSHHHKRSAQNLHTMILVTLYHGAHCQTLFQHLVTAGFHLIDS